MKTIQGNILDIDRGILVHQVNTLGVMGAGLAYQIRENWPIVYRRYRKACEFEELGLGTVQMVEVGKDLYVANLAGQESIGGIATRYEAYDSALPTISHFAKSKKLPIYFPKGIGCGLAGGDWGMMKLILNQYCPDAILVEFQPQVVEA